MSSAPSEPFLIRETSNCTACALGSAGLPRCAGFGPGDAEVAVVGIAPSHRARDGSRGAFEIPRLALLRGDPPRGLRGCERAVWALARAAGIDLSRVYSTNAVKCALPGNRRPTPLEVRRCLNVHLMTELSSLGKLRAVLILGTAVGAVLGLSDFGRIRTLDGTLAEGTLLRHPVYVLRRWTALRREAERWASAAAGREHRS